MPTFNGKWVKDPSGFVPDAMAAGNLNDSIISYTARLGFKAISLYDQGFLRPDRGNAGFIDGADFNKQPIRLTSGNLSHKAFSDLAAARGLIIGRTTITNSLAPGKNKPKLTKFTDSMKKQISFWLTKNKWSPEIISIVGKKNDKCPISHEWIYQWIWQCKQGNKADDRQFKKLYTTLKHGKRRRKRGLLNVVIVNPADKEELALTISARKSKFNRNRFVEFGQNLGLTNRQIEGVFARLFKNKQLALDLIDISFLSDELKEKYRELLVERYNRLEG